MFGTSAQDSKEPVSQKIITKLRNKTQVQGTHEVSVQLKGYLYTKVVFSFDCAVIEQNKHFLFSINNRDSSTASQPLLI